MELPTDPEGVPAQPPSRRRLGYVIGGTVTATSLALWLALSGAPEPPQKWQDTEDCDCEYEGRRPLTIAYLPPNTDLLDLLEKGRELNAGTCTIRLERGSGTPTFVVRPLRASAEKHYVLDDPDYNRQFCEALNDHSMYLRHIDGRALFQTPDATDEEASALQFHIKSPIARLFGKDTGIVKTTDFNRLLEGLWADDQSRPSSLRNDTLPLHLPDRSSFTVRLPFRETHVGLARGK